MATENKSKPSNPNKNNKKRKTYLPHNKVVKKGAYPLRPGVEGFFITCDGGRERQAAHEAINVIDTFYEELVEGKVSKAERAQLSKKPVNKVIKFEYSDSSGSEDEDEDANDNDVQTEEVENKNAIATVGEGSDKSGVETKDDASLENEDANDNDVQTEVIKFEYSDSSGSEDEDDDASDNDVQTEVIKSEYSDSSGSEDEDEDASDNDVQTEEVENKNAIATVGEGSDKSGVETEDDASFEKQAQEEKEEPVENHDKQEDEAVEPPVKRRCLEADESSCGDVSKKVEVKSVDKLIEAELAELGDRSKRHFNKLDTGCNGVVFVQMRKRDGDPTPKDIVQHMMTSIASTKKHVSRFLLRVLPVEVSCYTSEEEITRAIKPLIDKYFPLENQVPRKFAVLYDARANTGVDRAKVINAVAKSVPSLHKVDLTNPDINIMVQIVKTVCLIGVVEKYKELAKYNLRQLSSSQQH